MVMGGSTCTCVGQEINRRSKVSRLLILVGRKKCLILLKPSNLSKVSNQKFKLNRNSNNNKNTP